MFDHVFVSASSFILYFIHLLQNMYVSVDLNVYIYTRAARYTDLFCYQFYAQIYRKSDKNILMLTPSSLPM